MNNFFTALEKILENPEVHGTNYNIAYYLLTHYDDIQSMNLQDLANACFVSSSTIKRFFMIYDLKKFAVVKEMMISHKRTRMVLLDTRKAFHKPALIKEMLACSLSNQQLNMIFNEDRLQKIGQMIFESSQVIFAGAEEMSSQLLRFRSDLSAMGKPVLMSSLYKTGFITPQDNDLVFLFSMSGRTLEVNTALYQTMKAHPRVIFIGQNNSLQNHGIFLPLPQETDDAILFMIMHYYFESIAYLYKEPTMILNKLYAILALYEEDKYEYQIARYLLTHKEDIESLHINDIMNETHVSKSTIIRFCKKIGYQSFLEVQYLIAHSRHQFFERIEDYHLDKRYIPLFENKKRLIIIGAFCSLASLVTYRALFFEVGIELFIAMDFQDPLEDLSAVTLSKEDLIIQVSLFETPMDHINKYFTRADQIEDYARAHQTDYLHIGSLSAAPMPSHYYEIRKTLSFAHSVCQLDVFFEGLYNEYLGGFIK